MQKALAMSMAMANEGKTDGGDAMAAEPTGASEGAASASASAGADAMDVEGKEGEGKDAGGAEEPNMVLPPVDTAMMNEVVAMGFPEVRVRKVSEWWMRCGAPKNLILNAGTATRAVTRRLA